MNKLSQFANGAIYDDDRNVHEIHNEKLDKLALTKQVKDIAEQTTIVADTE